MRTIRFSRGARAFTLIELICVIAVIAVLASLLLPAISHGQARAKQIGCVNNLRQVGLAFQNFAHDHNGLFPMAVPAGSGGSQEFTATGFQITGEFFFSFRHFQALSNDLVTPKLLACPADLREPATNFSSFDNRNLSYFVGLRADYSRPYSLLAGDRNLTNDYASIPTLLRPQLNRGWRWTSELHQFKGNLLFADTHVEEKTSQMLSASIEQAPFAGELALPNLPRRSAPGLLASSRSSADLRSPRQSVENVQSGMPNEAVKAQNPAQEPMRRESLGSTPITSRASYSAPDTQTITSAKSHTTPPQAPTRPPEKPSSTEEPGFSFFPEWLGTSILSPLKSAAWLIYLLLLFLAGTALFLRLRSSPQKKRHSVVRWDDEK